MGEAEQIANLARMRTFATALLLVMAALLVLTRRLLQRILGILARAFDRPGPYIRQ
jgi:hypothetical protein